MKLVPCLSLCKIQPTKFNYPVVRCRRRRVTEFHLGCCRLRRTLGGPWREDSLLQSVNWVKIVREKRRLSLSEWMRGPLEDRIGG